jgi:hypothetical protein
LKYLRLLHRQNDSKIYNSFDIRDGLLSAFFPAPEGYVFNLANPQRSGTAANFWVGTICMIIAGVFLFIRIYTKTVLARNFTLDDSESYPVMGRK